MLEREPTEGRVGSDPDGHVSLEQWEELTGRLNRIENDANSLVVVLSTGKLVLPKDSIEGTTLVQQLETHVGDHISILRAGTGPNSIRVAVGRSISPD